MERVMASKQAVETDRASEGERDHTRQSRAKRGVGSAEAQKWRDDNASTAAAWAKWVDEHDLPLRPLF
jgi:hypothetical protein